MARAIIGLALVLSIQVVAVIGATLGDRKMALWDPSDDLLHPDAMRLYIEGNEDLGQYKETLLDAAKNEDRLPKNPLRRRKATSIRKRDPSEVYGRDPGYDEIRDMSDDSDFSVQKIDSDHNLGNIGNVATNAQRYAMTPRPLRRAGRISPPRPAHPLKKAATTFDDIIKNINSWESYDPNENQTPIVPQDHENFKKFFFKE